MKQENQLIAGTTFTLMISGATSMALGSLIPFFRRAYDLSYEYTGILVSLQSAGTLAVLGLFMATISTTAISLGAKNMRGNDLGVSAMTLTGVAGGIITPAAVGFVAEHAGLQMGMGVVVGATVMLLIMILINTFSDNASK